MSRCRTGVSQAGRHETGVRSPREGPEHLQGTLLFMPLCSLITDSSICLEMFTEPY